MFSECRLCMTADIYGRKAAVWFAFHKFDIVWSRKE